MVSATARIAVLPRNQRELEIRDVTFDEVGPHEVLIRQKSFGICHSQLARLDVVDRAEPLVLGHESTGTVIAVGQDVTYVAEGEEVVVTWIPRSSGGGREPVPSRVRLPGGEIATTHNTFTWGTHALVDELYVVQAGDITPDLGSVLGCAVMTGAGAVMNSVDLRPGQAVAVWGAGGVGLCAVAAAAAMGASPVVAVDVDDDKLALAKQFGATDVVNAARTDAVDAVRELTPQVDGTNGVDYSFDCTGLAGNVAASLGGVRPGVRGTGVRGGVNVMVGIPRMPVELTMLDLVNGEKSLIGCLGGSSDPERDFPQFVQWAADGKFDAHALVTNRYTLDEINRAVDDLHHGRVRGRAVVEL